LKATAHAKIFLARVAAEGVATNSGVILEVMGDAGRGSAMMSKLLLTTVKRIFEEVTILDNFISYRLNEITSI
jgi:hypothetical protein